STPFSTSAGARGEISQRFRATQGKTTSRSMIPPRRGNPSSLAILRSYKQAGHVSDGVLTRWNKLRQIPPPQSDPFRARQLPVLVLDVENVVVTRIVQSANDRSPRQLAATGDAVVPPPVPDDALPKKHLAGHLTVFQVGIDPLALEHPN